VAAYALGWPLRAEESTPEEVVATEEVPEVRLEEEQEVAEQPQEASAAAEAEASEEVPAPAPAPAEEPAVEQAGPAGEQEESEAAAKKKKRIEEFIQMEKYFEQRYKEEKKELEQQLQQLLEASKLGMERQLQQYQAQIQHDAEQRLAELHAKEQEMAAHRIEQEREEIELRAQRQLEKAAMDMEERFNENFQRALEIFQKEMRARAVLLGDLTKKVRAMREQVATASKKEQLVSRTHQVCAALFGLLANLEKSRPFQADLARLRQLSEGDEELRDVLASIPPEVAQHGVRTPSELLQQFLDVRSTVRTQALVPENGGVAWQLAASALAFVTQPVKGNVAGSDPDAVLARAEFCLQRGDVQAAVDELSVFSGLAGRALHSWLANAKTRIEVERAVEVVRQHVASTVGA